MRRTERLALALFAFLLASIAAAPAIACSGTIVNQTANVFAVTFSDHNYRGPLCWVTAEDDCPPLSSVDRGYLIAPGASVEFTEPLNDGTWVYVQRQDRVGRQDSFWQSRETGVSCEREWITNGDTSSRGIRFNDPAPGDIVILAN